MAGAHGMTAAGSPGFLGQNAQILWFATRGTGLVCLVLLTAVVMLGVLSVSPYKTGRWPRFLTQGLHRNLSLVALTLLAVHVATGVLDDYVPITWRDAVVPFRSGYRPIWLGLGTLALDALLVVIATSLVRHRLGRAAWRVVHWSAYLAWMLAVVHGLGTGTDPRTPWVGATTWACALAVLAAVALRLALGWPRRALLRVAAGLATVAMAAALVGWANGGPLKPGWARKAGTPPPPQVSTK
jgi:methionine sulfoxide reductase heme-binding subunit